MTDTPDLRRRMAGLIDDELIASAQARLAQGASAALGSADIGAPVSGPLIDTAVLEIRDIAARALGLDPDALDPMENLSNLGIDSIAITEIMAQISRHFGVSCPPTVFFEASDLAHLTAILMQRYGTVIATRNTAAPAAETVPPVQDPTPTDQPKAPPDDWTSAMIARQRAAFKASADFLPGLASSPALSKPAIHPTAAPIAIVSLEGRFPNAQSLDDLAGHLANGTDCITEIPADRWDWKSCFGDPKTGAFSDVKYGGFVDGVDMFDAGFFNISPREAILLDPQHRLFMEVLWHTLEKGGIAPTSLKGRRVALFVGINLLDYTALINAAGIMEAQQMTGIGHAFLPNRLSFLLGLQGPSAVIDTACSSSAVAVHRAVNAIRNEGCEMAIAGGSNLMLSSMQHVMFSKVGMLAQDGRCKSFAMAADGYARADGVAAVLLKQLDLAERDGDPIMGVITGSAENHGGASTSLTAPNPAAQADVIAQAHAQAGGDVRRVGMIECHGTGTPLGDPVEVSGLKQAFGDAALQPDSVGIGSVKSNIGHTEVTAGLAGLAKVLVSLRNRTRFASLHCADHNPLLELEGSPFFLSKQASDWPSPVIDRVPQPRRAGISSFGAGGTNVHLVVDEYIDARRHGGDASGPFVVPISAKSESALRQIARDLVLVAETVSLAALAHTLQSGRAAFKCRAAFVVQDAAALVRQLDDFVHSPDADRAVFDPSTQAGQLAQTWVTGGSVDWSALWPDCCPIRITLPGYPFERKRFWLAKEKPEIADRALAPIPLAGQKGTYTVHVAPSDSFLADHRVGDTPVLPGVAYLEIGLGVGRLLGVTSPSLTSVVWMSPLRVKDAVTLKIRATPNVDGSARIEVMSGPSDILHAQMRVEQRVTAAPGHDLDALHAAMTDQRTAAEVYQAFDAMGLEYGPSHRVIEALQTGPDVAIAQLVHHGEPGELSDYTLHPGLADGALQAAIGLATSSDPTRAELPFALDRVAVFAPCQARMWAFVSRDAGKLNVDLMNADGDVCASLQGFATRPLTAQKPDQTLPAALNFAPRWDAHIANRDIAPNEAWIVCTTSDTDVPPAAQQRHLTYDATQPLEVRTASLLEQVMVICQSALQDGPCCIQVQVPETCEQALPAAIAALLRSVRREHPGCVGQVLWGQGAWLESLRNTAAGTFARCRGAGPLHVEHWAPHSPPAHAGAPWRNDGVYLITGGAGGLGRMLAKDILANAPGARVITASRTPPVEPLPGTHHIVANLADKSDTHRLIDTVRRDHGRLTGVIHAAGVLKDTAFVRKTSADLHTVLAPKVLGLAHLDDAIGAYPIEFLVIYGSIAGVLGSVGQTDYAAANAWAAGFAADRTARRKTGQRHGQTLCIAWPLWADGGMSLDTALTAAMTRSTGLTLLDSATGLASLYAALNSDVTNICVAAGDPARIATLFAAVPPARAPATAPQAVDTIAAYRPLLTCLTQEAAAELMVDVRDLDPDTELMEYGFDSIGFTQFSNRLNDRLDLDLTPTVFFQCPTLAGLTDHLLEHHAETVMPALGIDTTPVSSAPPVTVKAATRSLVGKPAAQAPSAQDGIAIIGMSGHFPGAPDLDAYWDVLSSGRDCITEIPKDRWDWRDHWGDPLSEPGKCNVKWGGFIDGLADFDAGFFGLSNAEARMMDPQQRLLLTHAWRLLEDAGYAPRSLAGSQTGVFIGTADTGYGRLAADRNTAVQGYAMTGLAPSLGPNRISYHFDFHGPSVAVETACSSALIAVHRAVESLRSGRCSAAIAGGINALLLPEAFVGFSKAGMLSPDGRCKPFSADANGYARGEGVGLVMLKPLQQAQADGDDIRAVIRASGENHGGHAASLTAPNPRAQAALLSQVYTDAGFDPRSVSYIEAHGTGTPLGDPIEVEALGTAFAHLTSDAAEQFGAAPAQDCAIGSVKSNIGHLELAAGIAGLIKVVLMMQHNRIPASLHCDNANPYLKLGSGPFRLASRAQDWPRIVDRDGMPLPHRAGVSSFGFGGSNAHVALEQYVPQVAPALDMTPQDGPMMIVLSARSEAQLSQMADQLVAWMQGVGQGAALCDISETLLTARDAMDWRAAVVATDTADLQRRLTKWRAGDADHGVMTDHVRTGRKIATLLSRDAGMREAAIGLAERGQQEDLLALWVGGFDVDWAAIPGRARGRRIKLPGYSLVQTRLWVGETTQGTKPHLTHLSGDESYVRDHIVAGRRILPGVVALDMIFAATGGTDALVLADHTWRSPVDLEQGPRDLALSLSGEGTAGTYSIADGSVCHVDGRFTRLDVGLAAPVLDLPQLHRAAPDARDVEAFYAQFAALGLAYGPAQRAISALWVGPGCVLARLDLPTVADTDRAVNPAMADAALQAVLALPDAPRGLPYSIRRTTIFGPTRAKMWAVVRSDGGGIDIDLCAPDGTVALRIEGFQLATPMQAAPVMAEPDIKVASQATADTPNPAGSPDTTALLATITRIAADTLEVAPDLLDTDTELGEFGFDSVTMTAFASAMNAQLGLSLTPADFFEYATLNRLATHVQGNLPKRDAPPHPSETSTPVARSAPKRSDQAPAPQNAPQNDPIVIVGQSGMFPMAENCEEFWRNLEQGRDCISRIPADRWDWQAIDGDPKTQAGRTNIHFGGFCAGTFEFDPAFFAISPREARLMDPQQRLMMMHAWAAIEDAGHDPRAFAGQAVGVFVGTSSSGYTDALGDLHGTDGYAATGAVPSVGPNRVSYFLDFRGPSEPVETACSSSLVALHRAVQAIEAGDCDAALVGGVNTIVTPEAHINFAKAGMLSEDGRCKTFSDQANGYVRGEGAGMIFVRRLSDAQRDGDPILAIVRGTGVNHGGHANSLTAPNTAAQAELIAGVHARAGIDASEITYLEAHGTGTALGDPVEVNALKSVFAGVQGPIHVGAVKTNIGHLELAAGIAGVIKVLQQLRHKRLAPSLHCDVVNPYITLADSPFALLRAGQDWVPKRDQDGRAAPRRAGISSFGFGGVNAHVVLEEYVAQPNPARMAAAPVLIVLSARTEDRLRASAQQLADVLAEGSIGPEDMVDLAFTLQQGRSAMSARLAVIATAPENLCQKLQTFANHGSADGVLTGRVTANTQSAGISRDTPLDDVAQNWVRGAQVDWATPYHARRLRLPTYPFAKDVFDLSAPDTHPANSHTYQITVKPDAFYLRDHHVQGRAMLPGAMSLEAMLNAASAQPGGQYLPLALGSVTWRRPIVPGATPFTLHLPIDGADTPHPMCRLLADDGTEHARAHLAVPSWAEDQLDIGQLWRGCPENHDPDLIYARHAALGLDYGPSLRSITRLAMGGDTVAVALTVPHAAAQDGFIVHPALLDGAFQAVLAAFDDTAGAAALPFAIDRVDVMHKTVPNMVARLRRLPAKGDVVRFDIDLADQQGQIAVRLRGFSLRLIDTAAPQAAITKNTATQMQMHPVAQDVTAWLTTLLARETEMAADDIDPDAPLEDYGIDSILITRLTDAMVERLGPLSSTLFFEHRTLAALSDHIATAHAAAFEPGDVATTRPAPVLPATPRPTASRNTDQQTDQIAIIGLAGRYPGARDTAEFWESLKSGQDAVTEVPQGRWDHSKYYDTQRQPFKTTSKWGGFIDGHDLFDASFFNIAPRDADYMDPQERVFLQCAWETLEDAGYTRQRLAECGETGVFVGVMYEEYQLYGPELSAQGHPTALAGSAASIANRVSYVCDFRGPSIAVDSMCSSALSAIHLACDALKSGSCATALAGGVNLTVHPNKYVALSQSRFLSSTGRCQSFGDGGDGYVPAEGVGAVLLKPLDAALRDGDRIHGVILGSALNHGGKTNGYTVPNPDAQANVICAAHARAGVAPRQITYVEAHGTGTSLGDPIEIAALTRAFDGASDCAIGSVKSNIGHAESAAGIAGLTKVLLQMRHRQLVPSLHARTLNPRIDFAASPFRVQRTLQDWPATNPVAGLSSFGAGGSNAHFVIAGPYPVSSAPAITQPIVFPVSARNNTRLAAALHRLGAALAAYSDADLGRIAFTLQHGREAFEARVAIIAQDLAGLRRGVEQAIAQSAQQRVFVNATSDHSQALEHAKHWTSGGHVTWDAPQTNDGTPLTPIALPSYPFSQDRHWLPGLDGVPAPDLPLICVPDWQNAVLPAGHPANPERRCVIACQIDPFDPGPEAELRVLDVPQGNVASRFSTAAALLLQVLQAVNDTHPHPKIVQVVVPETGPDALFTGLAGMVRCAALEMPAMRFQFIRVAPNTPDLAALLLREAGSDATDIRLSGATRQVRRWREIDVDTPVPSPWKRNGVYVLLGGAGGVGLHVAMDIARANLGARIWLTGRSDMTDGLRAQVSQLSALGAHVTYQSVDVTDDQALHRVLHTIQGQDGPITGVFHAAGVTQDGPLARKSAQVLSRVLAPKVAGAIALDHAVQGVSPDFVVLFASAAGALGNVGQSDYATANTFLDELAMARNGTSRTRWLSIDWPYWRDGGMVMPDRAIKAAADAVGVQPLDTVPAIDTLCHVLARPEIIQALVLSGDADRLRRLLGVSQPAAQSDPVPVIVPNSALPRLAPTDPVPAIWAAFADVLKINPDDLTLDDSVDRFGVDSVSAADIAQNLSADFGELSPTILLEHQTIRRLADALSQQTTTPTPALMTPIEPSNAKAPDDNIAVIAIAGRFPGCDSLEAFAKALRAGQDCVTQIPHDRLHHVAPYADKRGAPGATQCKWGGFLTDVDRFDAGFFDYTPRAADLADPQERLFLQTVWHLFERAGHSRARLAHQYDRRVGIFVGAMYQQYAHLAQDSETQRLLAVSSYAGIANRTSFFFDLQGPSVALDAMCASGLQAVHQACQSLRSSECRLAVAGGVNLSIHPGKYETLGQVGLLGSTAHSRAFSGGDGYIPAEAVGAVLLKPLTDAMRDGDRVLGVIRAGSANHAGHSAGYSVPDMRAQASLIRDTLARGGFRPEDITYIEAAATGSQLGDASELGALADVFGDVPGGTPAPVLGSVKANIGHAEAASGIAQLIKVLLQFQQRVIFPSFGFADAVAKGRFMDRPVAPAVALQPVSPDTNTALILSFGAGGANTALIVQEPPADRWTETQTVRKTHAVVLSAPTPEGLTAVREQLATYLRDTPDLPLGDVANAMTHGRERFEYIKAYHARTCDELVQQLEGDQHAPPTDPVPDVDLACAPQHMALLPGYPFARNRHWLPDAGVATSDVGTQAKTTIPLQRQTPIAQDAETVVLQTLAKILGYPSDAIDIHATLDHLGADSMARIKLAYELEAAFGLQSDAPVGTDTPNALAIRLAESGGSSQAVTASPPAARGPLSQTQTGLWVAQALEPGRFDYNVPMAFLGKGLDPAMLQRALDRVMDLHPLLGSCIMDGPDGPTVCAAKRPVSIHPVHLPKEADLTAFLSHRARLPFDLKDCVLRVEHLVGGRLDHDESALLIVAHHIVTDGTSAAVMATDFWAAYEAVAQDGPLPDRAVKAADYAEFTQWERDLIDTPKGQQDLAYWQERLAPPWPALGLPFARSVADTHLPEPCAKERAFPTALTNALGQAARGADVSVASLCLAALVCTLHRHSGAEDIIIGVPTLRRPEARFAGTIGCCVNMIAPRFDVTGGMVFGDLVNKTHRLLQTGIAHANYPLPGILRSIDGMTLGQVPWTVSFAFQDFDITKKDVRSITDGDVRLLTDVRQTAGDGLDIEMRKQGADLVLCAGFDATRFDPAGVTRFLARMQRVLEAGAADMSVPVSALSLGDNSKTPDDPAPVPSKAQSDPRPVPTRILDQARRSPKDMAVQIDGKTASYGALAKRVTDIARRLKRHGVRRGDRVAALCARSLDAIATPIAIMKLGAVWVPLEADMPLARLTFILDDAEIGHVVLHGGRNTGLPLERIGLNRQIIDLDQPGSRWIDLLLPMPRRRVSADDAAYVIYTSGSTGQPKGVVVSHGALMHHCSVISGAFGLRAQDRVLQSAPLSVDTAIEQVLPILCVGGQIVFRPKALPGAGAFLDFLQDNGVTVVDVPPLYLHELLRAWQRQGADLGSTQLRLMIVGGETLAPDVVAQWFAVTQGAVRLINAYGPTEATITSLLHEVVRADADGPVPIGRPLPGTQAYILDGNGTLVPEGVIGELFLGGPRLATEYLRQPERTAHSFGIHRIKSRDIRLYRTGDLASWRANGDGTIMFHGRIDDQVKLRGFRIEIGEIESRLLAAGVADAAVIKTENQAGDPVLTAHIVPGDRALVDKDLRAELANHLPHHMLPSVIVRHLALPKTTSGKTDRRALSQMPPADATSNPPPTEPKRQDPPQGGKTETRLAGIWSDVLGHGADKPGIDRHMPFDEAGGNSLLMVRLLDRIAEDFDTTLSVQDLIAAPTLAAQSAVLERLGTTAAHTASQDTSLMRPVLLKKAGKGGQDHVPLWLVHPVGGALAHYTPMVDAMAQHPGAIWGLRASGLNPGEPPPPDTIPDIAAAQCRAIRHMQPHGPYALAGWSLGGILAHEIARQLRASGDTIDALVLIDSYTPEALERLMPESPPNDPAATHRAFLHAVLGIHADVPPGVDIMAHTLAHPLTKAMIPGADRDMIDRLLRVFETHVAALTRHTITDTGGPFDLIVASQNPGETCDTGWRSLPGGAPRTHWVKTDHHGLMQKPHLDHWLTGLKITTGAKGQTTL